VRNKSVRAFLITSLLAVLLIAVSLAADETGGLRLSTLLGSGEEEGFVKALEAREFEFPRDHGPHSDYRNEWWYVTGNLDDVNGRRFGFELTIFRFALSPEAQESGWRSNQVYIAHLAVTDAEDERFLVAERFSRGALGLAGARAEPFRVWIDDWHIGSDEASGPWRLVAADEEVSIDVELSPLKAPVLNGVDGLSQKSAEPGNASYYYSITRLETEGTLRIGDESLAVSGLSWLDREWSSSALSADQAGWDWFALQLSDDSDLMFYNIRKNDGSQDRHSSGTWVDSNGAVEHIDPQDIEIVVEDRWDSPAGGSYPSRWSLHLPGRDLRLTITPVIDDQELFTTVRYWEGAVDVDGELSGRAIKGRGYVELTGYAE